MTMTMMTSSISQTNEKGDDTLFILPVAHTSIDNTVNSTDHVTQLYC